MVIYANVENGYLTGWGTTSSGLDNEVVLEVSKSHEVLGNPEIFWYEKGELIKDAARQNQLIDEAEREKNKPSDEELTAIALMELTNLITGGV